MKQKLLALCVAMIMLLGVTTTSFATQESLAEAALANLPEMDMSSATKLSPGTLDDTALKSTNQGAISSQAISGSFTPPANILEDKNAIVRGEKSEMATNRMDASKLKPKSQRNMRASSASPASLNSEIVEYMGSDLMVAINFNIPTGGKIEFHAYNESPDKPYDFYLFTSDYTLLISDFDLVGGVGNSCIIEGYLNAGDYIAVFDAYTGEYDATAPVHFWAYHSSNLDQYEIDDDSSNTAIELTDRVTLNRTLDLYSDKDWAKFTVTRDSSYIFDYHTSVTNPATPESQTVTLYKDDNGNLTRIIDYVPDETSNEVDIAPGTYYLLFEAKDSSVADSSYSFKMTLLAGSIAQRVKLISNSQLDVDIYKVGNTYYVNNVSMGTSMSWERSEGGPETWHTSRLLSLTGIQRGFGNYTGLGALASAITARGTYICDKYGTIDNTCVVQLGYGTTYDQSPYYHYAAWRTTSTGQNYPVEIGWQDPLWQSGEHFVVIDMNQGKVVDFLSGLNPYYDGKGDVEETWSFVHAS